MIKIEHTTVYGWEAAIRGMRNPKNSWDKSDSDFGEVGENDLKLMKTLAKAGDDHGKFLRYITVTADITAPLYWWKEYDTYKVSTVANSCSTMHKIHAKEFELSDFSWEHLNGVSVAWLERLIDILNANRMVFNATGDTAGSAPARRPPAPPPPRRRSRSSASSSCASGGRRPRGRPCATWPVPAAARRPPAPFPQTGLSSVSSP